MRQNEPVYFDETNGVWGITKYADVKEARPTPSVLQRGRHPARHRPDPDDDRHGRPGARRRRKLVNRGFTPTACASRRHRSATSCDEIIDQVCERGECDFVRDIAAPLPMIMIGDMLGVARETAPTCCAGPTTCCRGLGRAIRAGSRKSSAAFTGYTDLHAGVIADRRANPGRRPDERARARRGRRRPPRRRQPDPRVAADPRSAATRRRAT